MSINEITAVESKVVVYAGFGVRLRALFVDTFIIWAIPFAIFLTLVFHYNITFSYFTFKAVVLPVLVASYTIYLNGKDGATLGKRVCKIRIVKRDGTAISYKDAIIRYMPYLVMTLIAVLGYILQVSGISLPGASTPFIKLYGLSIFVWYLISIVRLCSDEQRRTLHDFFAKTVVIKV